MWMGSSMVQLYGFQEQYILRFFCSFLSISWSMKPTRIDFEQFNSRSEEYAFPEAWNQLD
jgi:hypothetical protein